MIDRARLALFARLSGLAYELDREALIDGLAKLGWHLICQFESRETDTQAYLARESTGQHVLAFRGTQPNRLQDILTDLDADLDPLPGDKEARAHDGFLTAWASIRTQVSEAAGPLRDNLTITGHSLGGALAVLAGYVIIPRAVVTFGQPRTGNARFAETVASETIYIRVVRAADPVPLVPPLFLGYRHGGTQIYLGGGKQVVDPSMFAEILLRAKTTAHHMISGDLGVIRDLAEDHGWRNYIVDLEEPAHG